MPKTKQSDLIASVKRPNIGFINKYIINSEIRGGGRELFGLLVTYQSLLVNIFSLAPPKLFFSVKYDKIDYSV